MKCNKYYLIIICVYLEVYKTGSESIATSMEKAGVLLNYDDDVRS